MGSVVSKLNSKGLITPPSFIENSIQYEVITGSVAYGVSSDTSDMDIYGFCIPSKEIIFPHLNGVIYGFDSDFRKFEQYQQHRIDTSDIKEYLNTNNIDPNITLDIIEQELKMRCL